MIANKHTENEIIDEELLKYLLAPPGRQPERGKHDVPCAVCRCAPEDFPPNKQNVRWRPNRHDLDQFGVHGLTGIACDTCYGRIYYRIHKRKS